MRTLVLTMTDEDYELLKRLAMRRKITMVQHLRECAGLEPVKAYESIKPEPPVQPRFRTRT